MTRHHSTAAATFLGLALLGQQAQAIPRTFVSASGTGATCSRTAPCATFQAAHDATDAGGEITCIDSGNFAVPGSNQGLTISKSITIDCAGTLGSVSGFFNNGILINTPGVVVRLRHLTIDLVPFGFGGVTLLDGAALFVESCLIINGGNGSIGIAFQSPAPGAKLFVSDSVVATNSSTGGEGIQIAPQHGFSQVVMDGLTIDKNSIGIRIFPPIDPGTANVVHMRDSVVTGSRTDGIDVVSTAGFGVDSLTIDRSSLLLNAGNGIHSDGSRSFVLLGRSTIVGNGTGLSVSNSGNIFSYQNNRATGNVSDGGPTAALTVK